MFVPCPNDQLKNVLNSFGSRTGGSSPGPLVLGFVCWLLALRVAFDQFVTILLALIFRGLLTELCESLQELRDLAVLFRLSQRLNEVIKRSLIFGIDL